MEKFKKNLYFNARLLAPDGKLLCKINYKKVKWYLKNKLAILISENPVVLKLKFEPKARDVIDDRFYLEDKENKCVVCGCEDADILTKHHIVPYCFRKYFPEFKKRYTSHDVVMLCEICHYKYEKYSEQKKKNLIKLHKINIKTTDTILDGRLSQAKKWAIELLNNNISNLFEEISNNLKDFLNKDLITKKDVLRISKINPYVKKQRTISYGKKIVENIKDIDDFIINWRKHFINNMSPKFMPKFWDINKIEDSG